MPITAAVSLEDVRRKFYEANGYSMWIREVQLDPLQLIIDDDATGDVYRMSIGLSGSDITFGERQKVEVEYVDASAKRASAVTYASRAESLDGIETAQPPAAKPAPKPAAKVSPAEAARRIAQAAKRPPKAPVAKPAAGSAPKESEGSGMPLDLAKLREAFGLADDLSDDEVTSMLAEAGVVTASTGSAGPPPDSGPPDGGEQHDPAPERVPSSSPTPTRQKGVFLVEASAWNDREERLRKLELREAGRLQAEGEQVIMTAVAEGKFAPSRAAYWKALWDADAEGTRATLNGLAAGLIPTRASAGYASNTDEDGPEDAEYAHLFPPTATSTTGGRR